jgi:microcin C transport system permease protein
LPAAAISTSSRCAGWSRQFRHPAWYQKILDYLWHITLPVLATVIGGFAALTMLTKNSFLDEIRKQYVVTARAKGVGEKQILGTRVPQRHAAGDRRLPGHLYQYVFYRLAADEVMFSLNGWGCWAMSHRLPRLSGDVRHALYFHLIGLLLNIVSDISYTLVDPRIDFEGR